MKLKFHRTLRNLNLYKSLKEKNNGKTALNECTMCDLIFPENLLNKIKSKRETLNEIQ
jgi:hypothetical protein